MTGETAIDVVMWITAGKLLVGLALFGVMAASVYKFRGLIFSVMGLLLLSNIVILILIAKMTS